MHAEGFGSVCGEAMALFMSARQTFVSEKFLEVIVGSIFFMCVKLYFLSILQVV